MKVLVTGGAGYIGSSLVEKLNNEEGMERVYVLDNLSRSPLAFFLGSQVLSKVSFVKGDILDSYLLESLVKKVDVVFHLAGYVSFPYNYTQNVQYEQINQWGTLNLVRSVQQSKKIKQIIYLSSASVYGLRGDVNIEEKPQPTNAYGKSKLAGEKYVQLLKDKCQVNIVRSANVFGFNNNFRQDSVLNNFIFQALVDKKILIYGDGSQQRPFVSLETCVQQLLNIYRTQFDGKNTKTSNAISFNADLNEIKNWLLKHIPDMEYTYINQNIEYNGQFIKGINSLNNVEQELDEVFDKFQKNIRIKSL